MVMTMAMVMTGKNAVNPTLPMKASTAAAPRRSPWAWLAGPVIALFLALVGPAQAAPTCPPPLDLTPDIAAPQDRGLLWRITRGGHSSWLFGTVHVGKPAWRRFGPQTLAALQASDVLALEIDPGDPALAETLMEKGEPLELPAAMQERLTRALERACLPGHALATLHPVLQATTLTVLEARWLGLDVAYAQEQLLMAQMRHQGRGVVALETAAQQKAALLPTDPGEALATLEQTLTQLEDQSGLRVLGRLAQAWEQGDLGTLESYEQWCECVDSDEDRATLRRLNDQRNPALAAGIAARHQAGRRVFAAVGALHMTGPQALPRLLAQKGFKVERMAFTR
jgi:uncharacterized protein YbaP (TraB family)